MSDTRIIDIKEKAEYLYSSGQFLCSEAVFLVINEYLGMPVPPEMVRLASGFPVGIGGAGCSCGALTGGVMALGLKYGRSLPGQKSPEIMEKSRILHDWFKEEMGSTCCRSLTRKVEFGGEAHVEQCTRITGKVAEKVAQLLDEEF